MPKLIYSKPKAFFDEFYRSPHPDKKISHYCPGCGHGHIHKFIAEALEDFEVIDRTIFVSPVGCSVFAYYYFNTGNIQAAHGRAAAVATGIKRAHPHSIVISYQGDGDLAAIGLSEIVYAANRGEHITVFFVNNAIYGMTGGQMAPTSLVGQKTTTSPHGRDPHNDGYPLRMCELLSNLDAPVYLERVSLHDVKSRAAARRAIRKALKTQIDGLGFSMVEILSPCPAGWKLDPVDALRWIEKEMLQYFPLGVYRDKTQEVEPYHPSKRVATASEIKTILGLDQIQKHKFPRTNPPAKYKNPDIKAAGFGGQGVLMLGTALAQAGMMENYHVSWIPSYGPEMRGGTANCQVRISEQEIGSPVVSFPSVLVAFNRPSLERFEQDVRPGGIIIYDNSLIDIHPTRTDVEIIAIPATQMADDIGSTRAANMVILGAYIGYTDVLNIETAYATLDYIITRKNLIEINRKAIEEGFKFGRRLRGGREN